MDTLPLPPHPTVEAYESCAQALVAAASSPDPGAVRAWATELLGTLARSPGVTITPFVEASLARAVAEIETRVRAAAAARASVSFSDAQLLLARAHGFESWAGFGAHVAGRAQADGGGQEFEQAADAIVSGDLTTLVTLLNRHPALVRARSARTHAATLLHYVAANGVEDWRQRTPPNAPAIARALLAAGAEVDALASTYGGGQDQTTMNLLVSSVHPAAAGLQPALVEVLLDGGAAVDGPGDDGSPLMTALAFGYAEAAGSGSVSNRPPGLFRGVEEPD